METITLDPHEFMPQRTELGLDDIGLDLRGEPDWGDAEQELFLVRQRNGEIPADRHPPNRTVIIPLQVRQEGATNLSQAALKLQKKVGLLQREGGFVRRDLDASVGFPNSVATRVHGAQLSGLQGWMMAHRGRAPDVTLQMVTDPYFYGITEKEAGPFSTENATELKWEIAEVPGTAPGLLRVQVKNEDAVSWRSMIMAIESRDNPQDGTDATTADLAYAATALTKEGSVEAERETIKVVRKEKLKNLWQTVLSSKITASGKHMTHVGPRRFWVRIFDPQPFAGQVELRLEWRSQGSNTWTQNSAVPSVTPGVFMELDLGECRPETHVLGSQKWEWRITARGTGSATIDLVRVWILPTEQYLSAVKLPDVSTPGVFSAQDFFASAGALNGKKEEVSEREWETSGDATDFTELGNAEIRETLTDATTGRKALLKTFEIKDGVVQMLMERAEFAGGGIQAISQTLISRGTIELQLVHSIGGAGGPATEIIALIGGTEKAKVTVPLLTAATPYLITIETVGNSAFMWVTKEGEVFGEPVLAIDVSAVEKGRIGFRDKATGLPGATKRTYSKFRAWETEADALCYAGRSIEARSEGLYRQHSTDEVWARMIPDGQLPYLAPGGLEARKMKGIIIPSWGEGTRGLGNKGPHKLKATVKYFPGYHFTP